MNTPEVQTGQDSEEILDFVILVHLHPNVNASAYQCGSFLFAKLKLTASGGR